MIKKDAKSKFNLFQKIENMRQVIERNLSLVIYLRESTKSNIHNLCDFVTFISHIKPSNIHEAEVDSYWLFVMQEELNQFERNQAWRLISRTQDRLTIGTKWMFRNKLDKSDNIIRNKARRVAQGYNQI